MQFFRKSHSQTNQQEKLGTWPVRMRVFELATDFELTMREQPEIFVVHSGKAVMNNETGTGKQVIAKGSVIVLRPGYHEILTSVQHLTMTALRFLPEWLSDQSETLLESEDATALWGRMFFFELEQKSYRSQVLSLDASELAAIDSDFVVIRNAFKNDGDAAAVARSGLVKFTLLKVLMYLAAVHGKFWRGEQRLNWPEKVPELLSLLERTASRGNRMNLRQAASESGIDESQLVKLLTEALGLAPIDYLERRRAQHAARLILAGGASNTVIAKLAGFNNSGGLDEQMKAVFGRTSAEYRTDFCS